MLRFLRPHGIANHGSNHLAPLVAGVVQAGGLRQPECPKLGEHPNQQPRKFVLLIRRLLGWVGKRDTHEALRCSEHEADARYPALWLENRARAQLKNPPNLPNKPPGRAVANP